uniref:Uncharacterized protein n=1 Tax=Megaselia scalaris TaxID=36166 RepID=T1GA52_MEGSC
MKNEITISKTKYCSTEDQEIKEQNIFKYFNRGENNWIPTIGISLFAIYREYKSLLWLDVPIWLVGDPVSLILHPLRGYTFLSTIFAYVHSK